MRKSHILKSQEGKNRFVDQVELYAIQAAPDGEGGGKLGPTAQGYCCLGGKVCVGTGTSGRQWVRRKTSKIKGCEAWDLSSHRLGPSVKSPDSCYHCRLGRFKVGTELTGAEVDAPAGWVLNSSGTLKKDRKESDEIIRKWVWFYKHKEGVMGSNFEDLNQLSCISETIRDPRTPHLVCVLMTNCCWISIKLYVWCKI